MRLRRLWRLWVGPGYRLVIQVSHALLWQLMLGCRAELKLSCPLQACIRRAGCAKDAVRNDYNYGRA